MAMKEIDSLVRLKDENGDEYIAYPISKGANITYDNTSSQLEAEDMQAAIDLLVTMINSSGSGNGSISVSNTAPEGDATTLWIDTASGGVPKYWDGTAWVPAKAVWG